MTPATGTALLVLVIFVLPGFIAILVKERIYEVPSEQLPFERLLQTLYYSMLVYSIPVVAAVAAGANRDDFERLLDGESDLRLTVGLGVAVALVLPVGLAYMGRLWMISEYRPRALERMRISTTHRTQSSWDYAWDDGEPCLVVARLKAAKRLAATTARSRTAGMALNTAISSFRNFGASATSKAAALDWSRSSAPWASG